MSVGPFSGILGSAAGAPVPQSSSNDSERTGETRAQERKADSEKQAEEASGIGQTSEDQQSSDRDADGRRLWEGDPRDASQQAEEPENSSTDNPRPKDPTGNRGGELDITG